MRRKVSTFTTEKKTYGRWIAGVIAPLQSAQMEFCLIAVHETQYSVGLLHCKPNLAKRDPRGNPPRYTRQGEFNVANCEWNLCCSKKKLKHCCDCWIWRFAKWLWSATRWAVLRRQSTFLCWCFRGLLTRKIYSLLRLFVADSESSARALL